MTILTRKIIYCNYCGYEEPNDYYFGTKYWIFAEDGVKENFHFCSMECTQLFNDERDNFEGELILINKLNSNDVEFKELLN
jgi:hypothetical protein